LVIRPLRYRAHGHTLYRQAAYLLVDDPKVPVAEALQAGKKRMKKADQFLADAMSGHFGKKFPITARAIMDNAWT
jgi:hypothetical protein